MSEKWRATYLNFIPHCGGESSLMSVEIAWQSTPKARTLLQCRQQLLIWFTAHAAAAGSYTASFRMVGTGCMPTAYKMGKSRIENHA